MTITLDKNVLLSESSIWQQQCDFYKREGVAAWYNQVPFYATSNAFIARAYAQMIRSFIIDWHAQQGSRQFKIVELGAGCGQFSYLCLQNLQHLLLPDDIHWNYIMSDFDEPVVEFWRSHNGFKPFVEAGNLIFAQDKIGEPLTQLTAELAGADAPVIIIANYLFDSLPADIYQVSNEQVHQVNVTLSTEDDNVDTHGAVIDFEKVGIAYMPDLSKLIAGNEILELYRLELLDSHILYPTQSLKLLDQLSSIVEHGLLLLSTDKAYSSIDELDYLDYPEITGHNGCFSMMVNFDAIKRYAKLHKGNAYIPSVRAGIKTAAFSVGFDLMLLPALEPSLSRHLQYFSPGDYLNLYRNMQKKLESFNLEDAASFLALSNWDAVVFQRLYERIFEQLDGADMLTINYLLEHLPVVADHFYWLERGQDVLFQIAVIFHTLKRYEQALIYYERSLSYFDGIFGLYFNMGVCHQHLGQNSLACECFEKAHELDPLDKKTCEWLSKLRA
jgi:tetratricopeptide (TPR) repeat protein